VKRNKSGEQEDAGLKGEMRTMRCRNMNIRKGEIMKPTSFDEYADSK